MAKEKLAPKARLTLELDNEVLMGMAGGQHVHCLVRTPTGPGGEETIEHGLYRILPPVENPMLGRIAILTHVEEATSPQIGTRSSVGSATLAPRAQTYTISQAAVQHVLAGGAAPRGTLIMTAGPLGGSNFLVVTSGFEELMDLLEESGGGTLEVEP
jgi:hypothetical protein